MRNIGWWDEDLLLISKEVLSTLDYDTILTSINGSNKHAGHLIDFDTRDNLLAWGLSKQKNDEALMVEIVLRWS
jgi:hypothetical protein